MTDLATAQAHLRAWTGAHQNAGPDPENIYGYDLSVADAEALVLDAREVALVDKFRAVTLERPDDAYLLVSLPPEAMQGDEQRDAITSAVEAVFAALAAVAR